MKRPVQAGLFKNWLGHDDPMAVPVSRSGMGQKRCSSHQNRTTALVGSGRLEWCVFLELCVDGCLLASTRRSMDGCCYNPRMLDLFRDLEEKLLRQETRNSPGEVATLLHPDFFEFGQSGTRPVEPLENSSVKISHNYCTVHRVHLSARRPVRMM